MSGQTTIEDLLLEWEEAQLSGQNLAAEELCHDHPELLAQLKDRISALKLITTFLDASTESAAEFWIDSEIEVSSRFKVIRHHASGGKGVVYLASDELLSRDIAFKVMRPNAELSNNNRARFWREAQITCQLDHPGVVPVIAASTRNVRHPFYCMRFIKGRPLAEEIASHYSNSATPTDWGPLLRPLISVCNTVAYAHSRNIIHRDLKPSNIMVGDFGEVLVVDWGIARRTSDASDELSEEDDDPKEDNDSKVTQHGAAIGTPSFMSPEQVEGDADRIGPATDIYALGATLYTILTGTVPYQDSNPAETMELVKRGHLIPPSDCTRMPVPRALEAVCLKAMASRPTDRYSSALGLAEDLERWSAGEAVSCCPETMAERTIRWGRTHRLAFSSMAILLMTAVPLLGIGNWLLRAEQERSDINYRQARQAVDRSFTRIAENKLLGEPGMLDLRHDLLVDALSYYQEFVNQRSDEGDLAVQVARAHMRIAAVKNQSGSNELALHHYEKALALLDKTRQSEVVLAERVSIHQKIGATQTTLELYDAASASLTKSRSILNGTSNRDDSLLMLQAEIAVSEAELAMSMHDLVSAEDSWSAALTSLSRMSDATTPEAIVLAVEVLIELIQISPETRTREYLSQVPASLESSDDYRVRSVNADLKRIVAMSAVTPGPERLTLLRQSIAQLEILTKSHPSVVRFHTTLADCWFLVAQTLRESKKLTQAVLAHGRAYRIREFIAGDVSSSLHELAELHYEVGKWHLNEGRIEEAFSSYEKSRSIQKEMGVSVREDLNESLGRSQILIGYYLWENTKIRDALEVFKSAAATLSVLSSAASQDSELFEAEAAALMGTGMCLDELGQHSEALGLVTDSIAVLARARELAPGAMGPQIGLSTAHFLLEGIHRQLGNTGAAEQARAKTLAFQPDDPEVLYQLARNYALHCNLIGKGNMQYSDRDRSELDRYQEQALVTLASAIGAGLSNPMQARNDPGFSAIRWHPRFVTLLKQ